MSKEEINLEIEKEKTKRAKLLRDAEIVKDSRWGKYGVIGSMLLLTAAILIALLIN